MKTLRQDITLSLAERISLTELTDAIEHLECLAVSEEFPKSLKSQYRHYHTLAIQLYNEFIDQLNTISR